MTMYANDSNSWAGEVVIPTLEDFAVLSAQYQRAFVKALPTYTGADNYLSERCHFPG